MLLHTLQLTRLVIVSHQCSINICVSVVVSSVVNICDRVALSVTACSFQSCTMMLKVSDVLNNCCFFPGSWPSPPWFWFHCSAFTTSSSWGYPGTWMSVLSWSSCTLRCSSIPYRSVRGIGGSSCTLRCSSIPYRSVRVIAFKRPYVPQWRVRKLCERKQESCIKMPHIGV